MFDSTGNVGVCDRHSLWHARAAGRKYYVERIIGLNFRKLIAARRTQRRQRHVVDCDDFGGLWKLAY